MVGATVARARGFDWKLGGAWPLTAAFALLAIPTAITLGDEVWSRESGAHGPIVLGTGAWLLWRQIPELKAEGRPGPAWLTALILAPALALYVFGRAYDFISLEAAGLYGVGIGMLHSVVGLRVMLKNWFPFLYLGFMIPPPDWVLDYVTAPLKHFVSYAATEPLSVLGIPLAREGVTIFVAQYQLLVEDACSGLNSLVGLTAISLLYIYLMRGSSWIYSLVLLSLVIPIAVIANIIRIVILICLTYFVGDEVAQGFSHFAAGLVLFASALLIVFGIDKMIFYVLGRRRHKS
jgi:exosortase